MDYTAIGDSFSLVELTHLSAEAVRHAIDVRTTTWRYELEGEHELYGSLEHLQELYRTAGNFHLSDPVYALRDEWDGTRSAVEYTYKVVPR
jgi:hypothetical protein